METTQITSSWKWGDRIIYTTDDKRFDYEHNRYEHCAVCQAEIDFGENEAYIFNLYVNERCRGNGYGSGILAEVEKDLNSKNIHIVRLSVDEKKPKLIEFYTHRGYERTEKMFDGEQIYVKKIC